MQNNHPTLRIFACMKTRMDGRPSCGARGASEIITRLREELRSRGLPTGHIDVRPCACLDRCDRGPILLGYTGQVAEQAMPPVKLPERLLRRPKVTFERVTVAQIPAIVDQLVGLNK